MSDFEQKLNKALKHIKLSVMDKDNIRGNLAQLINNSPAQAPTPKNKSQGITSPLAIWQRRFTYALAVVVAFVAVGGGAAKASENSLPGDFLYNFKVGISEEIKSVLIFNEIKKAEWEAERLQRRLLEIKALVEASGTINDKTINEIGSNVRRHGNAVTQATARLQSKGNTEAIINIVNKLQGALDSYGNILAALVKEEGVNIGPELGNLVLNVEQTEQAAKEAQLHLLLQQGLLDNSLKINSDSTTVGQYLEFISPRKDDVLVMGSLFTIEWEIDLEKADNITIMLLRAAPNQSEVVEESENNFVGFVGAGTLNKPVFRWNPRFVLEELAGQSKQVESGSYKLRMVVEAKTGATFAQTSEVFRIVDPNKVEAEKETGILQILVVDENDNSVSGAYVEVTDMHGDRIDAKYADSTGRANFELHPGDYNVLADTIGVLNEPTVVVGVYQGQRTYQLIEIKRDVPEEELYNDGQIDLIVENMKVLEPRINTDDQFTVSYDVANIGYAGLAGKRTHGLSISPDLDPNDYYIARDINDSCAYDAYLAAGARCRVTRNVVIREPGSYIITATIDSGGFIKELREDNNTATVNKYVANTQFLPISSSAPSDANITPTIQITQEKLSANFSPERGHALNAATLLVNPTYPVTLKKLRVSCKGGLGKFLITNFDLLRHGTDGKISRVPATITPGENLPNGEQHAIFTNLNETIERPIKYVVIGDLAPFDDTIIHEIKCGLLAPDNINFYLPISNEPVPTAYLRVDTPGFNSTTNYQPGIMYKNGTASFEVMASEAPVKDAKITIYNHIGQEVTNGTTDISGKWEVQLPAVQYEYRLFNSKGLNASGLFEVKENETTTIKPDPAYG